MDTNFTSTIENTLYKLNTTLADLNLSVDELYAYAKKYKFNQNELEAFIREKYKASKNKSNKINLTEADYLEMLKLSRNSEFADSMVYYKGKVLGRCPKGTIKTGKTCVPGTDAQKFTKYKPGDLGGISNKQIKKLSKAKTIDDIIKAHKEENEQND